MKKEDPHGEDFGRHPSEAINKIIEKIVDQDQRTLTIEDVIANILKFHLRPFVVKVVMSIPTGRSPQVGPKER